MFAKYIVAGEHIVAWFPESGSKRFPYSEENLDKVEQMIAIYNYRVTKKLKEQKQVKKNSVFIGNIYKCTEYQERSINSSENSLASTTYDMEIIKENARLIKKGYYYVDADNSDILIAAETWPRRKGQVYVIEEELKPYHEQLPFKLIEIDDEIFIVPIQGNIKVLSNNSIVKRAINIVLGIQPETTKEKLLQTIENIFESLCNNPIVKHNCERMAEQQKTLVRKKGECPDAS